MSKVPEPTFQLPPSIVRFPLTARIPVLIATSPPSEFCRVRLLCAVSEATIVKLVVDALLGSMMTFDREKFPDIVWPQGTTTKVPDAAATVPAVQVEVEVERIVPDKVRVPPPLFIFRTLSDPVVWVQFPVKAWAPAPLI